MFNVLHMISNIGYAISICSVYEVFHNYCLKLPSLTIVFAFLLFGAVFTNLSYSFIVGLVE